MQTKSNRNWTTSEEADLSCYKAPDVKINVYEDFAHFSETGTPTDLYGVMIFAIGDNQYLAHQAHAAQVWITDSLQDCCDAAAEMVITAER